MSDQGNIFNDNKEPAGDPSTPQDNSFADKLKEIVNENGEIKYKTVEDALDALKHSQEFIPTVLSEKKKLEQEYQSLKAELEKRASVEDVVEKILQNRPVTEPKADPPKESVLDESKVETLVSSLLERRDSQRVAEQNLNRVNESLLKTYGDKAKEVLTQRAKELNTSVEAIKELSSRNPEMVLGLFADVKVANTQKTTPTSSPPRQTEESTEYPSFEKSLLRGGASNRELMEALRKSKEYTNKRLGVES